MSHERARESGLWSWLRGKDGEHIRSFPRSQLVRVENTLMKGFSDAVGAAHGEAIFLELKSVSRQASGKVWCELKTEQAVFLLSMAACGARCFVLVQVGVSQAACHYLIRAEDCRALLEPVLEEWLAAHSLCPPDSTPHTVLEFVYGLP